MRPGEYHIVRDDAANVLVVPSGSTLLDDPVTTLSGPKATFGRTPPDTSTLSAGSPTPSERGTSSCGPSTCKVSVGGTSAQSQRPTDTRSGDPQNASKDVRAPPPARPDRSKGRASYNKALTTYHEKWKESAKEVWEDQKSFWQEQRQAHEEWERKVLEEQRRRDERLVESCNNTMISITERLLSARQQPQTPMFIPPYMQPHFSFPHSPASMSQSSCPSPRDVIWPSPNTTQ